MAHFAKLDSDNIVTQIVTVNNSVILDDNNNEVEQKGIDFCKSLYGQDTVWVQTSYNGNIRNKYAGIGYKYDSVNDVFYGPKPYPSWTLNTTSWEWEAPLAPPGDYDGLNYTWNEDNEQWDLIS